MKFIRSKDTITIKFEDNDTPEETRLVTASIDQLLYLLQIVHKPKRGVKWANYKQSIKW